MGRDPHNPGPTYWFSGKIQRMGSAIGFHRANNLQQALEGIGLLTMVGPLHVPHIIVLVEPGSSDRDKVVAFLDAWPEGSWRLIPMDPWPSHDRIAIVTRNLTAEMLKQA